MSSAKHTPGAWCITERDGPTIVMGEDGDRQVCSTGDDQDNLIEEIAAINAANARLIAAAPDLLEALEPLTNDVLGLMFIYEKELRPAVDNTKFSGIAHRLEKAYAAIAKAEGKS